MLSFTWQQTNLSIKNNKKFSYHISTEEFALNDMSAVEDLVSGRGLVE